MPNRLIHSTSPYLLQHAHNPVEWREWNDESLAEALQTDKPILVSIGYSSCHWCHVMEKQSFENEDIASLMNEYFVCIKVDREERPDVDQVYMEAVQALGGNGGWPLNVFLTPDQKPFFGGTYFAPQAWSQVLINIHKAFLQNRDKVNGTAEELTNILSTNDVARFRQQNNTLALSGEVDASFNSIKNKFDTISGGIAKAPKFIMPSIWQWMLRYHHLSDNSEAIQHTSLTLNKILAGGIYDQVGGGFARYSVDKEWFAPHFEKMLYDNAQLLSLYAEAFAVTKNKIYETALTETFDWLQREMKHNQGAYYSALDADSEGEEGNFYVWTHPQLEDCLLQDSTLALEYFECTKEGNWEHGKNILKISPYVSIDKERLATIKAKLLVEREKRPRPGLDDKIITSWNAMTVIGFTDAYRYTANKKFLEAAINVMTFLEKNLVANETIYRSYKGKASAIEGFLDDYAYVIAANIQLHQVTLEERYLYSAKQMLEATIQKFFDTTDGYFFYSPTAALIARKKETFDNVIPSSNSVMARNLLQLSSLFENDVWKQMATVMIDGLRHVIRGEIQYTGNWGMGGMEAQHGYYEVVVSGEAAIANHQQLLRVFQPFALYLKGDASSTLPLSKGKEEGNNIYVCFNKSCKLPVSSVAEALAQLT
jgi:uncharacterized protein